MSNHEIGSLWVIFVAIMVLVWSAIEGRDERKRDRIRAENKARKKEKKRLKKLQAANALQNSNELNPQT